MGHYSYAQKPNLLVPWSNKVAENLYSFFKDTETMPVLIYSGMSGISCATSIMQSFYNLFQKNLFMIYVRKENEESHGTSLEYENLSLTPDGNSFFNYDYSVQKIQSCLVFVDDFISSGSTLYRCLNSFYQRREVHRGFLQTGISPNLDRLNVVQIKICESRGNNTDTSSKILYDLKENKFLEFWDKRIPDLVQCITLSPPVYKQCSPFTMTP